MLSSLPPELLRKIIEATVPLSYHSATYQERQTTLCSLSLVSRQCRAIAQPLLKIVWIKSNAQLSRFIAEEDNVWWTGELLVGEKTSAGLVQYLIDRGTGLQSLTISRDSEQHWIEIGKLYQWRRLVNLQLLYGGFQGKMDRPFASLRSLTIDDSTLFSVGLHSLDPEILPSLRALGLQAFEEQEIQKLAKGTSLARLLPQLEAIVVPLQLYRLVSDGLFSGYSPRILVIAYDYGGFEFPSWHQSLASVHHLRIHTSLCSTPAKVDMISKLIAACERTQTSSLKSIYLDPVFHPCQIKSPDLLTSVEGMMEECKRNSIEIVYDLQRRCEEDPYISKEFWSRQRRQREKEREKE